MKRKTKSTFDIVSDEFAELEKMKPTKKEIDEYAKSHKDDYGVVTYSRSQQNEEQYFLRLHDTWKVKRGGRIHIDIGYSEHVDDLRMLNTVHLMLDKDHAPYFTRFIRRKRTTAALKQTLQDIKNYPTTYIPR